MLNSFTSMGTNFCFEWMQERHSAPNRINHVIIVTLLNLIQNYTFCISSKRAYFKPGEKEQIDFSSPSLGMLSSVPFWSILRIVDTVGHAFGNAPSPLQFSWSVDINSLQSCSSRRSQTWKNRWDKAFRVAASVSPLVIAYVGLCAILSSNSIASSSL